VICSTLGCTPNDLLVLEQDSTRGRPAGSQQPELRAAAGEGPIRRRHAGQVKHRCEHERRRGPRDYRGPARSCEQCYGWGVFRGRLCRGCQAFHRQHPVGICVTCRRGRPSRSVRGCADCAASRPPSSPGPDNKFTVDYSVAAVTGQQLFFADLPGVRTHPASHGRRPATRPA
jgi:hypothetical protein